MSDQVLREILSEADVGAPPPPEAGNIARIVRRRSRRRSITRVAAMALVVVGGALILRFEASGQMRRLPTVARTNSTSMKSDRANGVDAGMARREATKLAELTEFQEQMVTRLLAVERHDALERELRRTLQTMPPSGDLAVEREAAAAILLAGGDELLQSHDGKAAAGERYRSVLQLFPDTRLAPVATDRLKRLST